MAYTINGEIRAKYYSSDVRDTSRIKWIVIHYTANSGTTATAKGNANYFANCPRKASAHYVVDTKSVVYRCVPDNRAAWAVGDSGAGRLKGVCTNYNSISIEMVSHSNANGYYIPAETINRTVELTQALMQKYDIDADHVIRHYDVTGKACPATHCGSKTGDANWQAFKTLVTNGRDVDDMTEAEVKKIINDVATEKAKAAVSDWAANAWASITAAGIMDGTTPQAPVTREQLAAILYKLGYASGDTPSNWAQKAWESAKAEGIFDGTNPQAPLTREQAAVVLHALGLIGTEPETMQKEYSK